MLKAEAAAVAVAVDCIEFFIRGKRGEKKVEGRGEREEGMLFEYL